METAINNNLLNNIQDKAFLLKGFSNLNALFIRSKAELTPEETDSIEYFISKESVKLTEDLKSLTDELI